MQLKTIQPGHYKANKDFFLSQPDGNRVWFSRNSPVRVEIDSQGQTVVIDEISERVSLPGGFKGMVVSAESPKLAINLDRICAKHRYVWEAGNTWICDDCHERHYGVPKK